MSHASFHSLHRLGISKNSRCHCTCFLCTATVSSPLSSETKLGAPHFLSLDPNSGAREGRGAVRPHVFWGSSSNPSRTAVPSWAQFTHILSGLIPQQDCSPNRVSDLYAISPKKLTLRKGEDKKRSIRQTSRLPYVRGLTNKKYRTTTNGRIPTISGSPPLEAPRQQHIS